MQALKVIDPLLSQLNSKPGTYINKQSQSQNKCDGNKKLNELLAPVAWLEGTWRTVKGIMDHPKIKEPFPFDEVISFTALGHQPIFFYTSVATNPNKNNELLHLEIGHFIINKCKDIGLLLVHKFGCTTIEEGTLKNDHVMELHSTEIGSSTFIKKPLYGTYRIYCFNNQNKQLTYKLALASHPGELIDHIWCTYGKVDKK